jgi:hypothetical protein
MFFLSKARLVLTSKIGHSVYPLAEAVFSIKEGIAEKIQVIYS